MSEFRPEFVEFIPSALLPGVLYISGRYRTASHLCACGCGSKVVTPLSPADWQLTRRHDRVSLHPSIGNWNYACRSHYWIRDNKIIWSGRMTEARIARVQERDRSDKARQVEHRNRTKVANTPATEARPDTGYSESPSWWVSLRTGIKRLLGLD
jgi:hypothetical protein